MRDTKHGEAITVHLPPILVKTFEATSPRPSRPSKDNAIRTLRRGEAGRSQLDAGVPFLQRHPEERVFRFHQGGHLRDLLAEAMRRAHLSFPRRQRGFHLFCHTYATWMVRYGKLDNYGLARTGRWKDPRSAEGYLYLLPTPPPPGRCSRHRST